MTREERVSRMRALLASAVQAKPDAVSTGIVFLRTPTPPERSIRRRAMVKQIQLAAGRYNLQEDIDAYLAAADRASLSGLSDAELARISDWVGAAIDRMATACDSPDAVPAR